MPRRRNVCLRHYRFVHSTYMTLTSDLKNSWNSHSLICSTARFVCMVCYTNPVLQSFFECTFIHSFIHLFIHSFIHTFTHSFIRVYNSSKPDHVVAVWICPAPGVRTRPSSLTFSLPTADVWIVSPLDSAGTRTGQFINKPYEQAATIYLHLLHSKRRRSRVPAFCAGE